MQVVKLDPIAVRQVLPAYVFEAQKAIESVDRGTGLPTGRNDYNEFVAAPEGPDLRVDMPKFVDFLQSAREESGGEGSSGEDASNE